MYKFTVGFNPHLIADHWRREAVAEAKIRSFDNTGYLEPNRLLFIHLVFNCSTILQTHCHRFRNAMQGQMSCQFLFILPCAFDSGAFEMHGWIFFRIKKIGAFQVVISCFNSCVQGGHFYVKFKYGVAEIRF